MSFIEKRIGIGIGSRMAQKVYPSNTDKVPRIGGRQPGRGSCSPIPVVPFFFHPPFVSSVWVDFVRYATDERIEDTVT